MSYDAWFRVIFLDGTYVEHEAIFFSGENIASSKIQMVFQDTQTAKTILEKERQNKRINTFLLLKI